MRSDGAVLPKEGGALSLAKDAKPPGGPPNTLPPKPESVDFPRPPKPESVDLPRPPKPGLFSPKELILSVVAKGDFVFVVANPPKGDLEPSPASAPKGDTGLAKLDKPESLNLSSEVCGSSSGRSEALGAWGLGDDMAANGDAAEVFEKPEDT